MLEVEVTEEANDLSHGEARCRPRTTLQPSTTPPPRTCAVPKGRVPDVANQDGGQHVPSAMTVDAQLVRLHRRRTLAVTVRPRYRQACAAGAEEKGWRADRPEMS